MRRDLNPHGNTKFYPIPQHWEKSYTEEEKAAVTRINNWLNETERSRGWISSAAAVNRSTLSGILNGKYIGKKAVRLKQMTDVIDNVEARKLSTSDVPFIQTSVSRLLEAGCNRARLSRRFSVIAANVGTGKTRALKEYVKGHSNTFLVEADPAMSPGALLEDLIVAMGVGQMSTSATHRRLYSTVMRALNEIDNALIILDEAETSNSQTLETLRRISDKTGTGIVLAGTTKLYSLVSPQGGQFDQIRSRSPFFPKPIYSITPADTMAILTAALMDRPEVFIEKKVTVKDGKENHQETDMVFDPVLAKRILGYTQGSMRVLVDNMIPQLLGYGLRKHKGVTLEAIDDVAKEVLSLELFDVH